MDRILRLPEHAFVGHAHSFFCFFFFFFFFFLSMANDMSFVWSSYAYEGFPHERSLAGGFESIKKTIRQWAQCQQPFFPASSLSFHALRFFPTVKLRLCYAWGWTRACKRALPQDKADHGTWIFTIARFPICVLSDNAFIVFFALLSYHQGVQNVDNEWWL